MDSPECLEKVTDMSSEKKSQQSLLKQRVPILAWLPKYTSEDAVADMIAGITVGLTVMPQALAYAALAGLEPQYGLYSSFFGCFVYTIFGSCKDITIGPAALMSLMTYEQVYNRNSDYAVLLCFLSGCVMVIMAICRLGVLVEFISQPVTVGFTTATSVIIVVSQIKGLLGLSFKSEGFIPTLKKIAENIHETKMWDTTMGVVCIIILLFLRKVKDFVVADKHSPKQKRVLAKGLWLLSTSRNALVVVICSLISFVLQSNDPNNVPFKLTGAVRSGIPPFQLPPFSTQIRNETIGFTEMVSDLGSSIFLVPIIAVLGNVAIAKAFASGGTVDATQELLTLAGCNLLGSFVSSMPVTGSFSRSAVNHASGVRTPMGGVYTGVLLLLALGILTPYFYYIPKASLAAVIISAVIFMIEYEVIKPMWKASRKDLLPMFITFVVCLLVGVELGILIGVGTNIALLLIYAARPDIYIEKIQTFNGAEYIRVKPSSSIHFPGVEHFRNSVLRAASSHLPVVLDCSLMHTTDFTTAKSISSLLNDFTKRSQAIFFTNIKPSLLAVLSPICTKNFVHVQTNEELIRRVIDVQKNGIPDDITQVATELGDLTHRNKRLKPMEIEERKDCDEPLLQYCMKATVGSGNPSV